MVFFPSQIPKPWLWLWWILELPGSVSSGPAWKSNGLYWTCQKPLILYWTFGILNHIKPSISGGQSFFIHGLFQSFVKDSWFHSPAETGQWLPPVKPNAPIFKIHEWLLATVNQQKDSTAKSSSKKEVVRTVSFSDIFHASYKSYFI